MRACYLALLLALPVGACGGPSLETRTFDLHYLDGNTAAQIVKPYVYEDRQGAPGVMTATQQTITVRETRDNLDHIAQVLAEQDRQAANVRLAFQVIQADGAGPVDSAIAPVETQLRRLFRFRGYRLLTQGTTISTVSENFQLQLASPERPFSIRGRLESVRADSDSGAVVLRLELSAGGIGSVLQTRLTLPLGTTVVIGGQPGGGPGAIILAVRAESDRQP